MPANVRWVAAILAAAIVYAVLSMLVPSLEGGLPGLTPMLLMLNATLVATLGGVIAGGFAAPRDRIAFARMALFWAGMLVAAGRAAHTILHGGDVGPTLVALLGGAFSGGMLGMFVLILPARRLVSQRRRIY